MQMISIDDYSARSSSWHKAGRSSRLAEVLTLTMCWAVLYVATGRT